MKRLLDYDPLTDTKTFHDFDEKSETTYIHTEQNMQPHIELAKEAQKVASYSQNGIKNEWWHFAHLPNNIINKWLIEDGIDVFDKNHMPAVKRKLRDPEWRWLKMTTGKI